MAQNSTSGGDDQAGTGSPAGGSSRKANALPRPGILRRIIALGFLFVSTVLLAGFACRLIISDRYLWSQFIAFVPGWMWAVPGLVSVVLGGLVLMGRRRTRRQRLLRLSLWLWMLAGGYCLVAELNVLRGIMGPPSLGTGGSLRLAQWNLTLPDTEKWAGSYDNVFSSAGKLPDIYLLTTNQINSCFDQSCDKLRAGRPIARPGAANDGKAGWTVMRRGEIAVLSSIPIVSQHIVELPSASVIPGTKSDRRDWEIWYNAWADRVGVARRVFPADPSASLMEIVFDASGTLGRPLVVWLIDLPSDPLISRHVMAKNVRAWLDGLLAKAPGEGGLVAPDVILGDWNIPRGCHSLARIAGPGMTHAYDAASWGPVATWPRGLPLLHIDNTFVAGTVRALSYQTVRPPVSDHFGQVVDIAK